MQYFGSLTAAEREVFLSVIAPSSTNLVQTQTKKQKSKKKQLPLEFSEEAFYQKLVMGHNGKVKQRLLKLHRKSTKVGLVDK